VFPKLSVRADSTKRILHELSTNLPEKKITAASAAHNSKDAMFLNGFQIRPRSVLFSQANGKPSPLSLLNAMTASRM
jgi:hypothetical protein